jgi:hypothetical protein
MDPRISQGMHAGSASRVQSLSRRTVLRLSAAAVAVAARGLRRAVAQVADPGSGLVQEGRKHPASSTHAAGHAADSR